MVEINTIWPLTSNFCERAMFSLTVFSLERTVLVAFNAKLLLLFSWTVFSICTDKHQIHKIGLRDYMQWVLQAFSFFHSYHIRIYWVEVCWRQVQLPSLLRGVIKFSWCWGKKNQCDEDSNTWSPSLWERISTTSNAELPKHLQMKFTYRKSRKELFSFSKKQNPKHYKGRI